jgi:hypothetical protein
VIPAPPGLVALRQLDPDVEDDIVLAEKVVSLTEVDGIPVAWVIGHAGVICRADQLEGFVGFGWREPIVAAIGGWGWQVRTDQGRLDVEAWLVKGDGQLAAVVVDRDTTWVFDPDEEPCQFDRAPDNDEAGR